MSSSVAILMSLVVLTIAGSVYVVDGSLKSVYAQTVDPGTNPDPTAIDNSTDLGAPGDNSVGSSMPSDNSTDLGSMPTDPSTDLGLPSDSSLNDTIGLTNESVSAVPEFGTLASMILVLAVVSILVISKTKLKF